MIDLRSRESLPQIVGVAFGLLIYIALLFSPASLRLDKFFHGYYQHHELVGESALGLWAWLLLLVGVITLIVGVCIHCSAKLSPLQKVFTLTGLIILLVAWSPVLVVWGVIWSPVILLGSLLWALLCSFIVTVLNKAKPLALNHSEDLYQVELLDDDLELSDNDLELSEDDLELSEDDLELAEDDLELAEDDLELAEDDLELSEDDLEFIEGKIS